VAAGWQAAASMAIKSRPIMIFQIQFLSFMLFSSEQFRKRKRLGSLGSLFIEF
jgi:hypothetical protein